MTTFLLFSDRPEDLDTLAVRPAGKSINAIAQNVHYPHIEDFPQRLEMSDRLSLMTFM